MKYLFICTAWSSSDGGVQTVNRRLSKSVAELKNEVWVGVPNPKQEEIDDAKASNVILFDTLDGFSRITTAALKFNPDIIVGNGNFTHMAEVALHEIMPKALFVKLVHHDPYEIEIFKEMRNNKEETRETKTLTEVNSMADANLIVTIGQYLHDIWRSRLPGKTIEYIDVGIEIHNNDREQHFERREVLLMGRAESLQVKGIDIFAKAAGFVNKSLRMQNKDETFNYVIRGAQDSLDALQNQLVSKAREIDPEFKESRIHVRKFSTEPDDLVRDCGQACLQVSPSRAEGYGLVTLEMLSRGVPNIISSESGVAKLINNIAPASLARKFVWEYGESNNALERLSSQMQVFMLNQTQAYASTKELCRILSSVATWDAAANRFTDYCERYSTELEHSTKRSIANVNTTNELRDIMRGPITPYNIIKTNIMEKILLENGGNEGFCLFTGRGERFIKAYRMLLDDLKQNLDIMGLGMSTFRRDYGKKLLDYAKYANIRIALIDPAFPALTPTLTSIATLRESEERQPLGEFRRQIASYYFDVLKPFQELKSQTPSAEIKGDLSILLYQVLPAINIFRVDDAMFFGPYLLSAATQETPTILVNRNGTIGGVLFETLMRHFEDVWCWKRAESHPRNLENVEIEQINAWKVGRE